MTACLCIHGFTGSPMEVKPLAEYIQDCTDWECIVPTLPGHGETLRLAGITYQEWLNYAEEELKKLLSKHETVYLIGFSMGGLIASYLSTRYPVSKLILLSAAAYYVNPFQLGKDIRHMFAELLRGNITKNELYIRYKNKIINTPIASTIQFRRLVYYIRPLLPQIQIPTFIAQGDQDGIVPLKSANYLYNTIRAQNKKIIYIKGSKHHICHCEDNTLLFANVLTFLKEPS